MSSPILTHVNSPLRIAIFGHISAQPALIAQIFHGVVSTTVDPEIDLAIFAINPSAGINQETIALWEELSQFQVPRLVVVIGLDGSESDFEDGVMVANRVFDQLVTPYLVLHDDAGDPAALIGLGDLSILDYSSTPPTPGPSEPEHRELVSEFREEYLEALSGSGEDSFVAGLLFPAIPLVVSKGIGVDIINSYIEQISQHKAIG
jgi:hypothetical protein